MNATSATLKKVFLVRRWIKTFACPCATLEAYANRCYGITECLEMS